MHHIVMWIIIVAVGVVAVPTFVTLFIIAFAMFLRYLGIAAEIHLVDRLLGHRFGNQDSSAIPPHDDFQS